MSENKNKPKLERKNDKVLFSKEYKADIAGTSTVVGTFKVTAYELHGTKKDGTPSIAPAIEIRTGKRQYVEAPVNGYVLVDKYLSINRERFEDLAYYFRSTK
jgi:hypothetical protein